MFGCAIIVVNHWVYVGCHKKVFSSVAPRGGVTWVTYPGPGLFRGPELFKQKIYTENEQKLGWGGAMIGGPQNNLTLGSGLALGGPAFPFYSRVA